MHVRFSDSSTLSSGFANPEISVNSGQMFLWQRFGNSWYGVDGKEFFTFPKADRLNNATTNELLSCGVGYRVKAIKAVVDSIASKNIDIYDLKCAKYCASKQELL